MKDLVFLMFAALMMFGVLQASTAEAGPKIINVWPGLAPGETTSNTGKEELSPTDHITRASDITCPQLHIYRLEGNSKHAHPAVMVCPGGGYGILASDLEGSEIAHWLNSLGFVAAVLYYRVPNKREGAFQDAERAMSLLRANAKEYGIDPKHLGVLGFSAGGHLSAHLSTGYAKRAYEPIDKIDHQSCRPDFTVLVYPAYLIPDKVTGTPAPEVQPHSGMAPMFLTQTEDDPFYCVPAYAKALTDAGIPAHPVTYAKGGHGYGLRAAKNQSVHEWSEEAGKWLLLQVGKRH